MADYDVDYPPETLLVWIREQHKAKDDLDLWPSREYVSVARKRTDRGSFTEEDELQETVAVGNLDVEPRGERAAWTLHFRIEDELAFHLPEDASVPDGPEPIDFETFWSDFVAPNRGTAHVWLSAESSQAKASFTRFLHSLEEKHATKR